MRRVIAALLATAALMLHAPPAHAHTNIQIVGFQIVNGGYVAGLGVAPTTQVTDGPTSDGTLVFLNLDPVPHRLVRCEPCGDAPQVAADTHGLDVTIEPGERLEVVVGIGEHEYFDPAYPWMRGRVKVTS